MPIADQFWAIVWPCGRSVCFNGPSHPKRINPAAKSGAAQPSFSARRCEEAVSIRIIANGHFGLVEYADASPEVRVVMTNMPRAKRLITNFWKALAHDRDLRPLQSIKKSWRRGPAAHQGDGYVREATNQCPYCIASTPSPGERPV